MTELQKENLKNIPISDSESSNELVIIANEFNNNINTELSTIEDHSLDVNKVRDQINLNEGDLGTIVSIARIIINQNPILTNEQVATNLLAILATEHPNKFIRSLSKKMVKNKWGERHGG